MNKKPWEMDGGEFYEFAKKGKLYEAIGEPAPKEIGTGETPLSLVESEEYSYEDIAHWYITRRMKINEKKNWIKKSKKMDGLPTILIKLKLQERNLLKIQ